MDNDREILDTGSMLEESLINSLKGIKTKPISHKSNAKEEIKESKKNFNTEEILVSLYEVRDDLIESFQSVDIGSDLADTLTKNINRLGSSIRKLGAEASEFNPFDHVSGLQTPNMIKNAERVIETTKACYTLGQITEAKVKGRTINIVFEGKKNTTLYKALGTISSKKAWMGNEAIDYIYTPGEGRLFVKAFEDNKWIDKSSDYEIAWELEENEINEKNTEIKEEDRKIIANNVPKNNLDGDMDISDFDLIEIKK